MKKYQDYLEMARNTRDTPEVIDKWWKKNAAYAVDYIEENGFADLGFLMKLSPEELDAEEDGTAKSQALAALHVLGIKKFEGIIKDWYIDSLVYDMDRHQAQEIIEDLRDYEYGDDEEYSDMDDSDARDRAGELLEELDLKTLTDYLKEKRGDWEI